MKIALINENTQKKRNEIIYEILMKVANKYGHTVFNYGVTANSNYELDYVKAGVLGAILINTGAADFVITGCNSGQGVMIVSNNFPNIVCGYVKDFVDAMVALKTNHVNMVSIPFGKLIGIGMNEELEHIFETLFTTVPGEGFPKERKEIQKEQRKRVTEISNLIKMPMYDILDKMDKDFLKEIIYNEYFMENFFVNSNDDDINELLLSIIDA